MIALLSILRYLDAVLPPSGALCSMMHHYFSTTRKLDRKFLSFHSAQRHKSRSQLLQSICTCILCPKSHARWQLQYPCNWEERTQLTQHQLSFCQTAALSCWKSLAKIDQFKICYLAWSLFELKALENKFNSLFLRYQLESVVDFQQTQFLISR